MIKYKLHELNPINADIVEIVLQPAEPSQWIEYQAGQYVESKIDSNTYPLSIACAPRSNHSLDFHLRHDQNQPQALKFLKALETQKEVQLSTPKGKMIISAQMQTQDIVLIAGGTGIAPFRAILEDLYLSNNPLLNRISLFWGIRKLEDLYLKHWLNDIQANFSQFSWEAILSGEDKHWSGPTGWVHEATNLQTKNWGNTILFASGPYEMVIKSYHTSHEKGLLPQNFYSDMFAASD